MAQRFDPARLELSGEPFRVVEQVVPDIIGTVQDAIFSASANGVLAWGAVSSSPESRLTWFDRSGRQLGTWASLRATRARHSLPTAGA